MPAVISRAVIFFCLLFPSLAFSSVPGVTAADPYEALRARESITIAVTDSGLGGLSVVADAERKLRANGMYADVELVFYNALFTSAGGYNSLQGRDEKVQVFSRALQGLQDDFAPDIILIACNTLSVLYRDTAFATTTKTPVVGIVEDGVELIAARMLTGKPSRTIIFATETTVQEGSHKAALVALGIPAERIFTQKCPQLASFIELGYDGMETEFLIDAYVDEALAAFGLSDEPLYVSFNCTHYGYSLDAWRTAFAARGITVTAYLDPNLKMIDFLVPAGQPARYEQTKVRVRAVSMVEITPDRQSSIGRYLQGVSPVTAVALQNYELHPDLFLWRDLVPSPDSR